MDAQRARPALDAVFREEAGRVLAALIAQLGDFDRAEDAFQEAVAIALERWPAEGVPRNPAAWLTTTARRRVIDRLRHQRMRREKAPDLHALECIGPGGGWPAGRGLLVGLSSIAWREAWKYGERSCNSSISVRGSPPRTQKRYLRVSHWGGKAFMAVTRLLGPTKSTAQAKKSGVKAAPHRA